MSQTEHAVAVPAAASPTYRIRLARSDRQLAHPSGQTLLETLAQQQVDVEYQCRAGFCGACRCRLLRGQVSYRQTPLAFLQEGEILPCCCSVQQDIELDL